MPQIRCRPEHIRQNPGMYIGNTGRYGLEHIISHLVLNSLAEAASGYGRSVRLTFHVDGSIEVADDGRTPDLIKGSPSMETVLTSCPSGYSFDNLKLCRDWFDYSLVGALSEWLEVELRQNGETYRQEFIFRKPISPPQLIGSSVTSGLTLKFKLDAEIFGASRLSAVDIHDRLREFAYLYSGIGITLSDKTTGSEEHFEFVDGIRAWVESLSAGSELLHPEPIVIRREIEGVRFEVGLQWSKDNTSSELSFANDRRTPQGGTHLTGLRSAVTRSLNDFIRAQIPRYRTLSGHRVRAMGLTAVVSVRLTDPLYGGNTRSSLISEEARQAVETGVGGYLSEFFDSNPEIAEQLIQDAFARPIGFPITEDDWHSCVTPLPMLRFIDGTGSKRKALLFVLACWETYASGNEDILDHDLILLLADYAEAAKDKKELLKLKAGSQPMRNIISSVSKGSFGPLDAARMANNFANDNEDVRQTQASLVREIFGNPFQPIYFDPSWLTSTVLALATGIYQEKAFERMPILADALQDAGCDNEDILNHCRQPGEHVRGCWALDILLNRE